ncbi:MAG: hypothetical protein QOI64_1234 [Solirubrobacteraceae bacterium]|jgi:hypothetical protein|nr:hypothetical protein [Solirubrobacteraceae bacterium]
MRRKAHRSCWLGASLGYVQRLWLPGELKAEGYKKHELDRLVRRGEFARVLRGVYDTHPAEPFTSWLRCRAAIRYAGETGVALSHGSALWLLKIVEELGETVHIGVDRPRTVLSSGYVRTHERHRDARPIREVRGLPVVPLEEAVLGAWQLAEEGDGQAIVCAALRLRRTTSERLMLEAQRWLRFAGRATWTALVNDAGLGCHSPIELDHLRLVERPFGLPPADRQFKLPWKLPVGYGDAAYKQWKTIAELDGVETHTDGFRRGDLRRDIWAARNGWLIVRFTGSQIRRETAWVAESQLEIFTQRAHQLGVAPPRC